MMGKSEEFQGVKVTSRGFTLIELLVVIAIIALLISIIVPSLKMAKNAAKEVVCMNNEKQIGLFLSMYADANNNELIDSCDWNRRSSGLEATHPARWADQLFYEYRVTDSSEVFYCPASKVPEGIDKKWGSEYEFAAITLSGSSTPDTHASFTYGLRASDFDWSDYPKQSPIKLTKLKSPTSYLLLSDVTTPTAYNPSASSYSPELAGCHFWMFDAWHSFFAVHKKGLNILFADMSVSKYKVDDVINIIPGQRDMVWKSGYPAIIYPDGKFVMPDGSEGRY